jgi:hypothetical protein
MRYLFGFMCVLALGVMPLVGCSETSGEGGSGGTAGDGGSGGHGGTGGIAEEAGCFRVPCEDVECDDGDPCTEGECNFADGTCRHRAACDDFNDCTTEMCNPADASCSAPSPVTDGTPCEGGTCQSGVCELTGAVLPCTEQGIRNAIAAGAGPYTFDCSGPTTISTATTLEIGSDVALDGGGNLSLNGGCGHRVLSVLEGVTAELLGFVVTEGSACTPGAGIENAGNFTLTNTTVSRSSSIDCGVVFVGGGAIHNGGTMTLVSSAVIENGGFIALRNDGTMTLMRTTVSRNSSGGIGSTGSLIVIDSTVSDNAGAEAGIVVDGDEASLVLANSTVSGNGLGISNSAASLTLLNSTISGGVGQPSADGMLTATGSVIVGTCVDNIVISGGYNIESPGNTCGFDQTGDLVNITEGQLDIGPLEDNGGPTMTHALGAGSVAIDHIPAVDCEVDEDQRGELRPETGGTMCDVGSFEVQP